MHISMGCHRMSGGGWWLQVTPVFAKLPLKAIWKIPRVSFGTFANVMGN